MKDEELENAFNLILNYIDDKPNTRGLYYEIVNLWLRIQKEEEE